jgi:hypothetical protein
MLRREKYLRKEPESLKENQTDTTKKKQQTRRMP